MPFGMRAVEAYRQEEASGETEKVSPMPFGMRAVEARSISTPEEAAAMGHQCLSA